MSVATVGDDRCGWSDLPAELCHHCHPGARRPVLTLSALETAAGRSLPQFKARRRHHLWMVGREEPGVISCQHPTGDNRQLCTGCTDQLRMLLLDVPSLVAQLEVAVSRQVSFVDRGSKVLRTPGHPWHEVLDERPPGTVLPERFHVVPYGSRPAHARRRLVNSLDDDAAFVEEGWLGTFVDDRPADPVALAAGWLRGLGTRLLDPDFPRRAYRFSAAVVHAREVIERPPDDRFIGPCPKCRADVVAPMLGAGATLAEREAQTVQCPCGEPIRVAARLRQILSEAEDRFMTAAELVGAISDWGGDPVTRNQINWWVKSGRLMRHERDIPRFVPVEPGDDPGVESVQRPGMKMVVDQVSMYRVSDVCDLAAEAAARRARPKG